ncbi:hypothetical protein D9M72_518250 [compost metagenome]
MQRGQRHRVGRRGPGRAHHHQPAAAVAHGLQVVAGGIELGLDPARVLDQRLAVGRGPQPARLALEQRQADIVLQVLQPLGKPGLGGIQHGGGLAHVAGLGQAQQHLQVAQAQSLGPIHRV